ncbi:hypothetical protein [Pseudovibrio sp. JE062]|nr:hypothetical protein [Pseudovibrio sp. JE062]EEA91890.1 hypothetical protein PJE062_3514 [Pseudovibrio sp. JE062]EEA92041.1 hypothetical protein PJE062_2512 [Pseudovibrio sp. JE062]EEA96436.1 hypothetical protein PJE062_1272 [Pseudovibrio sp. JE062]
MGAIGRDHNLSITYDNAIPTLLHGIAPDLDRDRVLLKSQLEQSGLI